MSSHTGQMRSRSGPGVVPLAVALLLRLASCALQDSVAPNAAPGTRGISADRSAGPAPNFYVSPTGSPSGDGSFTEPWDLATALAGPAAVTPGSTIWLRGGMYTNAADPRGFASTLMGTPDAPILVRQYPGERATVTNILFVTGAYTWFWGFEVTNPAPQQGVMHGVHLKGPGIKVINLVVHDATDDGMFIGPEASGAEANGAIVYNNNYFVGGWWRMGAWATATVTGNTLYNFTAGGMVWNLGTVSDQRWSDNTLFGDPAAAVWRHDTTDVTTFDGWRTRNGFADPGTYAASAPTGVKIAVRPNQYEPGRANIIVYKWAQQSAVSVDVAGILNMGDRYVVQNAADFYGPPIASGIYTGRPLDLPMVGITPPNPVGVATAQPAPVTGPTFNVRSEERRVGKEDRPQRELHC